MSKQDWGGPYGYFKCDKCKRVTVIPCGSADVLIKCRCGNTLGVDRQATQKEIDRYFLHLPFKKKTKKKSVQKKRNFTKNRCAKHSPPFYQCCCECKNRLTDYSHPWTDGKKASKIRGYICHVPEYGFTHSGWCEHSIGCELITYGRKNKKGGKS